MEINIEMHGNIAIIHLSGSLVVSMAEQLKAKISELIENSFNYVLLDLGNVHFIDSSGIAICISTHRLLTDRDGMLVFIKPSEVVGKVLRITKADQKLNIVSNINDGIQKIQSKISGEKAG